MKTSGKSFDAHQQGIVMTKMSRGKPTPGTLFDWALIVVFFLLGLANLNAHEMWRDELQVWNIASGSEHLGHLFDRIRYEGHPSLWYTCIYFLTKATSNPVAMQVLHLTIAMAFVAVFIAYAPFPRWQKALFVFGYFPLFEYSAISRMYGMGILFLFIFLTIRNNQKNAWLFPPFVLALLANTSVYGTILAIAFSIVFFFKRNSKKKSGFLVLEKP